MEKSELIVRPETPLDYPKVYELNNVAFGRAEEAKLVDRLRSSSAFVTDLSLVATVANKVVGHILLSKIEIVNDTQKDIGLSLAPMAVSPSMQKQGIGSALINEGLARAKDAGYKFIVVLGHETFYPKFGFTPTNRWNIRAPFNVPATSFMALELQEDALEKISGIVQYPKEFDL